MVLPLWVSPAAPAGVPSVSPEPSILAEYLFFPFYDWIVQYYPASWIPNKVTLIGVFCTLLSSLLLLSSMPPGSRFVPSGIEVVPASLLVADPESVRTTPLYPGVMEPSLSFFTPTSLLILCGTLNLVYCVADNTDGRLARRDKKTSVIGEYLDHGLDCVTSLLSACICFCVLGCSLANMAISVCMIAMVTTLSHTLHFEKNVFIWGTRYASVDEAMVFFGVGMWLPLLCPTIAVGNIPSGLVAALFGAGTATTALLSKLKYIELVYLFYCVTQAETIVSVARRNWRMVCRLHVVFQGLNSVVLLGCLRAHGAHVEAALPATSVPGYTFGLFTYPAIWIITCACTSSIIVHIPIASKCARLPTAEVLPLAGVLFVWATFVTCPVGAAALAVLLHAAQVLVNLSIIKKRSGQGLLKK